MLKKLQKHKFLLNELVKRDFKKKYKRTVLGMLWSVLAPLLNVLVLMLVFSHLLGRNQPHFIIYIFSGTLIITGRIADVTTAWEAVLLYAKREMGFSVCEITKA